MSINVAAKSTPVADDGSHSSPQVPILADLDIAKQDRSFSYRFRAIAKLFGHVRAGLLRQYGVTEGQFHIMRVLWERDGVSQRELGDQLEMTSAATVFSVNMLERDGLAQRVKDPGDQRRFRIVLTSKGRGFRDKLLPESRKYQLAALRGFSETEARLLDALLDRIKANLQGLLTPQPTGAENPVERPVSRYRRRRVARRMRQSER
jgi:DNA-binding MarR family transcriptional regulator